MTTTRLFSRGTSFAFYSFALLCAVACFYFSLSKALFFWFHADELAASSMYETWGLFDCAKQYYLTTTVNRLSADLGVCFMAKTASLWPSPYLGWVFARLLFYTLIPLSMMCLIRSLMGVSRCVSLIIAFLLASFVYFILSDDIFYMFGLDLAIYATATWTFFMLLSLFSKSIQGRCSFILFCVFFVVNLSSQEVFLVISAFFIPLLAYHRFLASGSIPSNRPLHALIHHTLRDKRVWVLSALYGVSALMTLLAPGLAMRQSVWPSNGGWQSGLTYMVLSIEDTLYLICKCPILLLTTLLMGVCMSLLRRTQDPFKFKSLYVFLLISPIIYLMLTGYLIGVTPSLWIGAFRTNTFQWIEPYLNDVLILKRGGLAIRQNLFLLTTVYLDAFLLGFLIAKYLRKKHFDQALLAAALLLLVSIACLLYHPDRIGSLSILSTMTQHPALNMKFHVSKQFSQAIFSRHHLVNHEDSLANLSLDAYLRTNHDKEILTTVLDPVYQRMIPDYRVTHETPFIEHIYAMYKVSLDNSRPCVSFLNHPKEKAACSHVYGDEQLFERINHQKIMPARLIQLRETQGAELKGSGHGCMALLDSATDGEHFAISKITLKKGLNYFVFETLPVKRKLELYVYMLGPKTSVLFPWLNMTKRAYRWSLFGSNNDFSPVFSQKKRIHDKDILEIVVDSPVEQDVQLRWQHGVASNTIYQGDPTHVSQICKIQHGVIQEA